jgi:hypothetical protein
VSKKAPRCLTSKQSAIIEVDWIKKNDSFFHQFLHRNSSELKKKTWTINSLSTLMQKHPWIDLIFVFSLISGGFGWTSLCGRVHELQGSWKGLFENIRENRCRRNCNKDNWGSGIASNHERKKPQCLRCEQVSLLEFATSGDRLSSNLPKHM